MADYYQRLSGQDASFLVFEGPTTPMNVGGISIFEAEPLMTPEGGIDIERIKHFVASQLHLIPRYRQRLAYIPVEGQPVWIDDKRFSLDYHVRHVAVPRPGGDEQLKRLAADILSRPLDRQRPLWELWIIEGLQGGRCATVNKAHHCMLDGISGVDVATATMRTTPDATIEAPHAWRPRRVPSGVELLRDAVLRRTRLSAPKRPTIRGSLPVPRSDLTERLGAVWSALRAGLRAPADTPLNQATGAYRRFDWLSLDLAEVKEVKQRAGGTVNDVVLATVAGAMRRFLQRRRVALQKQEFRVAAPVNMRAPDDRTLGNRVSVWLMELPIQERDPCRRLAKVSAATNALRHSKQALGTDVLMQVADWTGPALVALGARFATRMNPYNLLVTNVPGPQFPLYLLGARMLEAYPLVPLFENQALGIALFSYAGRLCWGFNSDWDLLPDLHRVVEDVAESFAELRHAAAQPPVRRRASRSRTGRRPVSGSAQFP
jgi:diacylglycerol O-acyltransferase